MIGTSTCEPEGFDPTLWSIRKPHFFPAGIR